MPLAFPITAELTPSLWRAKSTPVVPRALTVTIDATVAAVAAIPIVFRIVPEFHVLKQITKMTRTTVRPQIPNPSTTIPSSRSVALMPVVSVAPLSMDLLAARLRARLSARAALLVAIPKRLRVRLLAAPSEMQTPAAVVRRLLDGRLSATTTFMPISFLRLATPRLPGVRPTRPWSADVPGAVPFLAAVAVGQTAAMDSDDPNALRPSVVVAGPTVTVAVTVLSSVFPAVDPRTRIVPSATAPARRVLTAQIGVDAAPDAP